MAASSLKITPVGAGVIKFEHANAVAIGVGDACLPDLAPFAQRLLFGRSALYAVYLLEADGVVLVETVLAFAPILGAWILALAVAIVFAFENLRRGFNCRGCAAGESYTDCDEDDKMMGHGSPPVAGSS